VGEDPYGVIPPDGNDGSVNAAIVLIDAGTGVITVVRRCVWPYSAGMAVRSALQRQRVTPFSARAKLGALESWKDAGSGGLDRLAALHNAVVWQDSPHDTA
jgi:hypothetical protein